MHDPLTTAFVLRAIAAEREGQDKRWGASRDYSDGTGAAMYVEAARTAKANCDRATQAGRPSWRLVLVEEVMEALAESDRAKLRAELIQVAAVAVAWIEAIDRRKP